MTTERVDAFDGALAGTLLPRLHRVAHLASSSVRTSGAVPIPAASDVEARAAKLELNKLASQLRKSLATLSQQAHEIPAGDLSLDDQDWLIRQLELELATKRDELTKLVDLTSFTQIGSRDENGDPQPAARAQEEQHSMQTE